MESLLEHPGWQLIVKAAQAHVDVRVQELLVPLGVERGAKERAEFTKGEAAGIQTFIRFPDTLKKSAEGKIADLTRQTEDDDADGN